MIFLILGSHPELSKAEIESVVEQPCSFSHGNVLFLENTKLDLKTLQQRLAGTIKIGTIIGEADSYIQSNTAKLISNLASEITEKNKICFGISIYNIGAPTKTQSIARERDDLGKEIKKILKETGRPVRYVSSKEQELSSVIVQENNLLVSGGEYCLFVDAKKIFVGKTVALQDYKSWSTRDFGRPARDSKSGMLPPKLARMMVNLSGVKPNQTLLDPFCGSGTILMEADLLGIQHIIGSDISEKAIVDTKKNFEWLDHFYEVNPTITEHLYVSSADTLDTILSEPVDVIVTETYLGQPRTKPATEKEIQKMTQELMNIYESSFQTLRKLIAKNGTAVIAFPAFSMTNGSVHHLNLESMLKRAGWTIQDQFLYKRSNQFVGRDILRLRP